MKNKILLCAFFLFSVYTHGTIRNVPATFLTIQSALSASISGDTVLVQPGVYYENITWPAVNSIVLLSAGDSSNTIIDGNAANRVITFSGGGIDTTTVMRGFKITNGRLTASNSYGGGMIFSSASPTIIECAITANRLDSTVNNGYGAGISCNSSSPVFRKSTISNNISQTVTWAYGGGVYCESGSNAKFYDCVISGNSIMCNINAALGGGIHLSSGSTQLTNCIISDNFCHCVNTGYVNGGGAYVRSASITLTNVLFENNRLVYNNGYMYGAGLCFRNSAQGQLMNVTLADNRTTTGSSMIGSGIFADLGSVVTATNSISWNAPNSGNEIWASSGAVVNFSYSCVRNGYPGTGNISTNPAFVSASDYHPQLTSPCLNAGTLTGAPSFDLENNPRPQPALSNPDMGCYEINQVMTEVLSSQFESTADIYPNPIKDVFTIYNVQGTIETVEFYNVQGKRIFSQQPKGNSQKQILIDLSVLPNGVYFCRIFSSKELRSLKFVKQ